MLNYTNKNHTIIYYNTNYNYKIPDLYILIIFTSCIFMVSVIVYSIKYYIYMKFIRINEQQILPVNQEEFVETTVQIINTDADTEIIDSEIIDSEIIDADIIDLKIIY